MGKADIVTNAFFEDNQRFADVVNTGVFHGKKVLQADKLEGEKRSTSALIGDNSRNSSEISEKTGIDKFRDVVKKSMYGANFALIGIENQCNIHYAMPVRVMGYDFLTYDSQLKKIKKIHKRKKDLSSAEYVSGFSKTDRLYPVVTIVVYYGEKPWDGSKSLFEMINWDKIPDEVREKAVDYPLYIIDVRRFENTEELETDVRIVFGFLQRQENRAELIKYIQENEEAFSDIDDEAYDMISILADSEELIQIKERQKGKESEHNMCKALDDMVEEARLEGIKALILDNLEEEKTRECILEKLVRRFQLTEEQAENYFEKCMLEPQNKKIEWLTR